MDIIRHKFLRAQLSAVVPPEIVSYIQEYDTIYRDLFTKHIVCNIPEKVLDFWNKHAEICKLGFKFGQMDIEKMRRYIFYYNQITIFVLPTARIDYMNKK